MRETKAFLKVTVDSQKKYINELLEENKNWKSNAKRRNDIIEKQDKQIAEYEDEIYNLRHEIEILTNNLSVAQKDVEELRNINIELKKSLSVRHRISAAQNMAMILMFDKITELEK